MVSGKYSALSGAVSREQSLGNVAANLANISTTGYKKNKISFESILRGQQQVADAKGINYSRIRKIQTDFSQGGLRETGRDMDLAIVGDGFFKIRKGGEIFYTRAGHFMLDENGMVKTEDGFNLLGEGNQPLQIAGAEGRVITINAQGVISVNGALIDQQIQLFEANDPELLKPASASLYKLEDGGGDRALEEYHLEQGSLETSNVNMMEEMAHMINTQRKFEADLKILESYSTLGDKLDELGTVA